MHVKRAAGRIAAALAAPLMLAGALAGPGLVPASAAPCQAWTGGQQPPSPGNGDNVLTGVAVLTACNAYAVGRDINNGVAQTLIEHWNGASWTVVNNSPNPGNEGNFLAGVRAVSASNVWAVGTTEDSNSGTQPLILHWNGTQWSVSKSPTVPGLGQLAGVGGTSANDVWAVGTSNNGKISALIEHFNGTSWSVSNNVPSLGIDTELSGVTATSTSNAWAVGQFTPAGGNQTALVLHWNGSTWQQQDSSIPAGTFSSLASVRALSATNAWAVGFGDHLQPLVLHFNSAGWETVTIPPLSSGTGQLAGVTASSTSNAWAVGSTFDGFTHRNYILHWDGATWTPVSTRTAETFLGGVAGTAGGFWAVGASNADAGPSNPQRAAALHCC